MQTRESDAPPAERVSAIFVRHPLWEDALALLTGTALVALGIAFYSHAGLLTGGTVGLAFLLKYLADWSFGAVFFLLNLPFYVLAIWRMGWKFTLRTVCAVGLVSLFAELTPQWVRFAELNLVYAAVFGGFAIGIGLLILFRHRASLGGVNILALFLQERFGLRAGTTNTAAMTISASIPIWKVPADKVLLSVLGAVALNLVLAINHRADRYMGVS